MIEGRVSEAQSSKNDVCRISVADQRVSLIYEGQLPEDVCDFSDLKIDAPLGKLDRKIRLPDGRIFETSDLEAINMLKGNGFWVRLWKTERPGWHLVPLAIATPFVGFAMYRLVMPVLIAAGMAATPDEALYAIDKSSMSSIDLTLTDETEISHERRVEVKKIFDELLESRADHSAHKITNRQYKYNLNYRSSNAMGANAFALPGGTIVVTDDLVSQFKEDYILAAVLAHEIGHVEHQHSLSQLYRALGMAAMVTMIAGDAGPLLEDMLWEGSALLSLSFSREHEMESDNYSYDLLKTAGYRTDGLIAFFEKMNEDHPVPESGEWMMTHPIGDKRIENIRAKMIADGAEFPLPVADDVQD